MDLNLDNFFWFCLGDLGCMVALDLSLLQCLLLGAVGS